MRLDGQMYEREAAFFANHIRVARLIKKVLSEFPEFGIFHKDSAKDSEGWECFISIDLAFKDGSLLETAKKALEKSGFISCGKLAKKHVMITNEVPNAEVHVYLTTHDNLEPANYFEVS